MKEPNGRPPEGHLEDPYNRRINYLRISVTDRCNLRCIYCTPAGQLEKLAHGEILSYEEILRIARIGVSLGIDKIRVTGGEPFVRKGIDSFLEKLAAIDGLRDLSLTTNGILLSRHLERLMGIGIKRLNISLDTLDPEKYRHITGQDGFDRVWRGILGAMEKGFSPIKINVVALAGINDDELADLAALSLKYPLHVRFIEQMDCFGAAAECAGRPALTETGIREAISGLGDLVACDQSIPGSGPASRFRIEGTFGDFADGSPEKAPEKAPGEIGFISPVSHHFCSRCNRLRLTADGRLRSCLLSGATTDIKGPLRSGAKDAELAGIINHAVENKPREQGEAGGKTQCGAKMYAIGG